MTLYHLQFITYNHAMSIFDHIKDRVSSRSAGPFRSQVKAFPMQMDRYAIALVFIAQILFFPYFPGMNSANELSRLYMAMAMVENQDFEITPFVEKYGNINDKSVIHDVTKVDGRTVKTDRYYSDKPPGTALMAVPGIALRQLVSGCACLSGNMRIARLLACILPTLLLLGLLRREMDELGVGAPARSVAILGYGLGTLAMPYSVTFYGHQPVAVMLYAVWFLLRKQKDPPSLKAAAAAAFIAGFCVMTEYQSAVYLAPLAVLFLFRVRPLHKGLPLGILALAVPVGFLAFYHWQSFGNAFHTGYNHIANPFFASVHEKGFMGIRYPGWTQFAGSFFLPSKGLLVFSPFLLFGFFGIGSYFKVRGPVESWFRVIQVLLPALFVSSMVYWDGGWTVGQRHLTPMVPFLVAPAALLMQRCFVARVTGPGLAAASILYTGLATLVYPHLPQNIPNPYHDLTIPLFKSGCLAAVRFTVDIPAYPVLVVLAVLIFLMLVAASILMFVKAPSENGDKTPGSWKMAVAAAVLVAVIPAGWYGWTSQVGRQDGVTAAKHRVYFENQCKKAGRWDYSSSEDKK